MGSSNPDIFWSNYPRALEAMDKAQEAGHSRWWEVDLGKKEKKEEKASTVKKVEKDPKKRKVKANSKGLGTNQRRTGGSGPSSAPLTNKPTLLGA